MQNGQADDMQTQTDSATAPADTENGNAQQSRNTPYNDQEPQGGEGDSQEPQGGEGDSQEPQGGEEDGDTFPRAYVERLRTESAAHRTSAREAREEAQQLRGELWQARVAAAGRLADPADLPVPEGADVEPDTVSAAIDDLLSRKPHLAARRAGGDIGQHQQRGSTDTVSLAGMLQRGA
jgi:hypothetical protein